MKLSPPTSPNHCVYPLNLSLRAFTETSLLSQPNATCPFVTGLHWKPASHFFFFDVAHQQSGSTLVQVQVWCPTTRNYFVPAKSLPLSKTFEHCLCSWPGPSLVVLSFILVWLTVYIWLPGLASFIVQYHWCSASSLALPNNFSKWPWCLQPLHQAEKLP